jgi:hypothetical protein
MPESGNWHGGTFTRWIAALPAAPQILGMIFGLDIIILNDLS